jgi:pseudolysin
MTQCSNSYGNDKKNYCWLIDEDYFSGRDPFGWAHFKSDEVNGGYSPSIDSYYAANVVKQMFHEWYGIPMLVNEDHKTPMTLLMRVHYGRNYDDAAWDGKQINIGDGGAKFYPLTSLEVIAHEIGHGFTQQHSGLGMSINKMPKSEEKAFEMLDSFNLQIAVNESFSDMTGMAAQFYVSGKNDWTVGRSVLKAEGALRYLYDPARDGVSFDNAEEYENEKKYQDINPHWGAGILNKAFYLIATSPGWDTHTAYNVMVKANMNYWTSSMKSFTEAGCGIVSAAMDYQYNLGDVRVALAAVGINTSQC